MQGYARCGEGTSNPRKAGQARCVDPSGVCIAKCVTCQRIRRTLAGTGILGSSLGGGICEPCGEGRHFVTAPVRSNLTETPGPRFGRVLAKKTRTACQRGCLMCWCFVRLKSTGTAGCVCVQVCLEAGLVTLVALVALVTLGFCGVFASSFHMAWVAQLQPRLGNASSPVGQKCRCFYTD